MAETVILLGIGWAIWTVYLHIAIADERWWRRHWEAEAIRYQRMAYLQLGIADGGDDHA